MYYGIKRTKSKLSDRLTGVYTILFAVILFVLSVGVFFIAFQFMIQKQTSNLSITSELMSDHLIEEIEENEPLSSPEILVEQNNDQFLSIFVYNSSGKMVNRLLNFPVNEKELPTSPTSPVLIFQSGHMMLCISQSIRQHDSMYGTLYIVQKLQSETAFLQLLALLLIGANVIGALAALWAGNYTSRKMLSPINQMIEATKQIGGSNLDARLEVPDPDDELKNLALTINNMLERVSAAYHQQGRFVADVSHELRTPLAVMQGNVDLLSRWGSKDPAVMHDSIHALQKQTAYMNQLVENLLFLARFDNMQSQLSLSTFSIRELFEELLEEQALIDPDHTYELSIAPSNDALSADRTMIKQLLRALIDNSVKYTQSGGVILLSFELDDAQAVLTVSDNGIGMDAEHCEHIFERFYRVDPARTRATGGMGLGLSIVFVIAQAHRGHVSAISNPGAGTTVSVSLPR